MGELQKCVNIGKTLESQLNQVGILTKEQLIQTGSKKAWNMIYNIDPSACSNRLCALEGAIQGTRWHLLAEGIKQELSEFVQEQKK